MLCECGSHHLWTVPNSHRLTSISPTVHSGQETRQLAKTKSEPEGTVLTSESAALLTPPDNTSDAVKSETVLASNDAAAAIVPDAGSTNLNKRGKKKVKRRALPKRRVATRGAKVSHKQNATLSPPRSFTRQAGSNRVLMRSIYVCVLLL